MRRLLLLLLFRSVQTGRGFIPRIIGGHDASINDYPYQVSILYKDTLTCGGSIISRSWILTAAHCVFGLYPSYLQVRHRSSYSNKDGTVIGGIKKIIWHDQFDERTYNYDIALIMLPTPITISATAKPINLAESTTVTQAGKLAVVTGWGRLAEDGEMSSKLQALTVPIVDQKVCKNIFAGIKHDITDNMICAGNLAGGRDTCQGDSGGPLVSNGIQIGIVSWGYGCAKPKYPGVYTRVAALRRWIKEKANV